MENKSTKNQVLGEKANQIRLFENTSNKKPSPWRRSQPKLGFLDRTGAGHRYLGGSQPACSNQKQNSCWNLSPWPRLQNPAFEESNTWLAHGLTSLNEQNIRETTIPVLCKYWLLCQELPLRRLLSRLLIPVIVIVVVAVAVAVATDVHWKPWLTIAGHG